jgi:tellurite methyltransferase
MIADQIKWNERHAERSGHHPPDTYLLKMQNQLKPGNVLDIACGRGRNGLHLAGAGFNVLATDISDVGLEVLRNTARMSNLPVSTLQLDLDQPELLRSRSPFDNIIIINFKPQQTLLQLLPDLLAPGGRLLWCSFNDLQIEAFGFAPDKALFPNEFSCFFQSLELHDYSRFEDDSGHRDGYFFKKQSS